MKTLSEKEWNHAYDKKDVKECFKQIDADLLEDWEKANGKTFTLGEIRDVIEYRIGEDLAQ